ncbi:hypothetical protein LXL04_038440 [Taraxacum kok-saghyz]
MVPSELREETEESNRGMARKKKRFSLSSLPVKKPSVDKEGKYFVNNDQHEELEIMYINVEDEDDFKKGSWFKREQIMKTRTREQTWSLDQFKLPDNHLHPPDHHLHPPPDHRRTTVGPPSVHHLHPSAHWTTDAPPPDHRRTTAGPPQSEIRMTLIYDADAEADEEMLTLMSV